MTKYRNFEMSLQGHGKLQTPVRPDVLKISLFTHFNNKNVPIKQTYKGHKVTKI